MKVEPAKQFPYSDDAVADLARKYGMHMRSYREASAGIENTTLIVDCTTGGRFVLRIYRQDKKTTKHIQAELEFMEYLGIGGIPIPTIVINTDGQSITHYESSGLTWQVIAMSFIVGEHVARPSSALLSRMATTQARMHILAADYPMPRGMSIRALSKLVETEFIPQIDRTPLDARLRDFLQRGADFEVPLSADLPAGPSHLDFNQQNILCRDDAVAAVLDFDDLSVVPYAVCLAYTLWDIYDTSGGAAMDAYLVAYEQLRPLSDAERRLTFTAALFRHYMITAIKVLDGQTSTSDIDDYLAAEQYYLSKS